MNEFNRYPKIALNYTYTIFFDLRSPFTIKIIAAITFWSMILLTSYY